MGKIEFGEFIARRRTEVGAKPEQLAKKLGRRSKSVVYDLESGEQDPTIEDLNVLARELQVGLEVLLLKLGARLNPPEAALLDYDLVQDLLALRGRHLDAAILDVRALRRDQDDLDGRR